MGRVGAVALELAASDPPGRGPVLADRHEREIEAGLALEPGRELGRADRKVGVQLVDAGELANVLLARHAGELVAAADPTGLEHAKRVAVVAGDDQAVAHRDLEIRAIVRGPVDDQRLGPVLIRATLELVHRDVGGRPIGLDELAGSTGLAREQDEGNQQREATHAGHSKHRSMSRWTFIGSMMHSSTPTSKSVLQTSTLPATEQSSRMSMQAVYST